MTNTFRSFLEKIGLVGPENSVPAPSPATQTPPSTPPASIESVPSAPVEPKPVAKDCACGSETCSCDQNHVDCTDKSCSCEPNQDCACKTEPVEEAPKNEQLF